MRFAILSAIVLLAVCQTKLGNLLTSGPSKITKQTIEFDGKKRVYYLYVPENVASKPPLIVTLHGSNREGLSLVEKWKDIADQEGFIVAGPNAMNSEEWSPLTIARIFSVKSLNNSNTIVNKRNPLMLRIQQLQNETAQLDSKLAEMQPGK